MMSKAHSVASAPPSECLRRQNTGEVQRALRKMYVDALLSKAAHSAASAAPSEALRRAAAETPHTFNVGYLRWLVVGSAMLAATQITISRTLH